MSSNDQQQPQKQKVEISVYANKLKNVAGFGKGTSDPYAVVTLLAGGPQEKPRVLGKTEVIKNSLNPTWITTFPLEYDFGQETKINVGVFDEVRKTNKPKVMGSAVFEIGDVLGARGNIKAKKMKKGGSVFVRVTQAAEINHGTLHLKLRGLKLKNVEGWFSKSDPFFVIHSQANSAGGRTWIPVYKSETLNNNLHPQWRMAQIDMEKLCAGDRQRGIRVEVFDWEKNGKHQQMGSFETTVDSFLSKITTTNIGAKPPKKLPALPHSFHLLHRGKKFGLVIVTEASIVGADQPAQPSQEQPLNTMQQDFGSALDEADPATKAPAKASNMASGIPVPMAQPLPAPMRPPSMPRRDYTRITPTFVDYISGGCEINLSIAVDFTGSNGDPRRPGTLHHIHQDGVTLNDYEKAISAVGAIIARYDDDQKFPVWGFGAKYGGQIQHCFQIGTSAELNGIGGILEGYRATFRTGLTMSGPTVFAEVINTAAQMARARQAQQRQIGKQSYGILLILTDGAVSDIQTTKMAIQAANDAPLSIIIIGIGNEDFSRMQFLDDFQQHSTNMRDIVQFVEFNRHKHDRRSLTKETLDEIPEQLVSYFRQNNITPLPPVSGSKLNIFEEDYNEEEDIDLSYDLNTEGEISLANDQQATYDAQNFGTYQSFQLPPAMTPPSAPAAMVPPAMAPPAPVAAAPVQLVNIQAPPNSYPGMQLQIQNPTTGKFQAISIPDGVQPGSMFAVSL